MTNYFTYPYAFCKAKCVKAEDNPTFCQNSTSNEETTKFVIAERTYNLPSFTKEELENEEWKTINGFPNYMLSNLGRVFSKLSYKILRPYISPSKKRHQCYTCNITLRDGKTYDKHGKLKPFTKNVHGLVKEHFMTVPASLSNSKSVIVVHKNNNPFDCRVSNLFITSMKNRCSMPNQKDIVRKVFIANDITISLMEDILNGDYPQLSIYYIGDNIIIIQGENENSMRSVSEYIRTYSGNFFAWSSCYLAIYFYNDTEMKHIQPLERYALSKMKSTKS